MVGYHHLIDEKLENDFKRQTIDWRPFHISLHGIVMLPVQNFIAFVPKHLCTNINRTALLLFWLEAMPVCILLHSRILLQDARTPHTAHLSNIWCVSFNGSICLFIENAICMHVAPSIFFTDGSGISKPNSELI